MGHNFRECSPLQINFLNFDVPPHPLKNAGRVREANLNIGPANPAFSAGSFFLKNHKSAWTRLQTRQCSVC